MHDRRMPGEEPAAAFLAERLRPALYPQSLPMDMSAWHLTGEPVPVGTALRAAYLPITVGAPWGGPWSTTWFRARATVPRRWAGRRVEAVFDLGFDPARSALGQAAALVHDAHGTPLQGLHAHTPAVPLTTSARGGEDVHLLVEAAANPPVDTDPRHGSPATAGDAPLYRLLRADLAVRDEDVWHLIHDTQTLLGLLASPHLEPGRGHEIRTALTRAVNAVDPYAVARTAPVARALLAPALARRAHACAHTFVAVAHGAPGPAPLWPQREQVRGTARAFSTLATLAEEFGELVVAAPAAQHYAWMKEQQPHVFERVRKAVADGNWLPVGGMWTAADTRLPGGEALIRQFVHGRRFFRDELGVDTDGVWLPDATGASAALPQLARLAGAHWLLGRRPDPGLRPASARHTLLWEGLDGTTLRTHLAPRDPDTTTLADGVHHAAPPGTTHSLLPLGHDDGAPDRGTLERARRLADLDGSPRVALRHPAPFLRAAPDTAPDAPDTAHWHGDLRLAPNGGTHTSQARTKHGNRRTETLLHEAELWSATAAVHHGARYPYDELDALWKQSLRQQENGILTGTLIAWAHEDAELAHRALHRRLERLVRRATGAPEGATVLNAGPRARREVVVLPAGAAPHADTAQPLADGTTATLAEAPAHGTGHTGAPRGATAPVTVRSTAEGHVLDNGLIRVHVGHDGRVHSARDLATGRDAIAPGQAGNHLHLHRDGPGHSHAARLGPRHEDTRRTLDTARRLHVHADGPLLARLRVTRTTGRSTVVQDLTLTAGSHSLVIDTEIDWRERDTVLSCAWPLDVHAEHSRADIQFGHLTHPVDRGSDSTEDGTDAAELLAHRWIHVGEHGFGVALAGDTPHGYDVRRRTRPDGGTTTVLRGTLLRAPTVPDPHADRGLHHMRHALRPGATLADALAEGWALALPLRPGPCVPLGPPLVTSDHPGVVVETVKLADDRSGDVVVRLYEARGGRATTGLTLSFDAATAHETDLLEEPTADHPLRDNRLTLTLRPFQILTLRLVRTPRTPEERGA